MEEKNDNFQLGFGQYLKLLQIGVLNPNQYSTYLKNLSLRQSIVFFIINASIWLFIFAAIKTFLLGKFHLFFSVLSEILIMVPLTFLLTLLFAFLLHILARVVGSRTKVKNNLKSVLFSTILLPFFAVPFFKILAGIITIYILIYCFKTINRFDKFKACVLIVIPVGILVLALYSMKVININLITR